MEIPPFLEQSIADIVHSLWRVFELCRGGNRDDVRPHPVEAGFLLPPSKFYEVPIGAVHEMQI